MPTANQPIPLQIDHVTIAGSTLPALTEAFEAVGLDPDYGGPHSNGVTHMALLGFDDGSYLELISTLEPGEQETAFWGRQIAQDGGPCAWAVQVDDVAAEADRLAGLGVSVDGPHYYNRRRPDGLLIEWDLAFVGEQGPGAKLPFIIKDITPRRWRVQPSASVAAAGQQPPLLAGVKKVVLGVKNLPESIDLFRRVYGWAEPMVAEHPDFGARLAQFGAQPVILATPSSPDSALAARLAQFGESPCAYLLETSDLDAAQRKFNLTPENAWFDRRLAWFNLGQLDGRTLGAIT